VVLGSGNLGLVYARERERLTLEDVMERWPRLVPGLAAHPGIGFVALLSRSDGPVAIGADGSRVLATGEVNGVDPMADFGTHAARMLLAAVEMPEAPDVYVNSSVDPSSGEVSAFEDLVGCHGGLGGWQDHAMLLAPVGVVPPGTRIERAEQVYALLVGLLESLGHRASLRPAGAAQQDADVQREQPPTASR